MDGMTRVSVDHFHTCSACGKKKQWSAMQDKWVCANPGCSTGAALSPNRTSAPLPTEASTADHEREQEGAPLIRTFESGATRSDDTPRDDPEGYLSPLVVDRFSQYMTKHRTQPDGTVRASDNWQKGMPLEAYIKGLWRHFLHAWTRHRGFLVRDPQAAESLEDDLCAILFNAQGYLHTLLVNK